MEKSSVNFIRVIIGILIVGGFFLQRKCAADRELKAKQQRQERIEHIRNTNPNGPFRTHDPFAREREEFNNRNNRMLNHQ